ncbi:unnamed protein product [Spirodela intermedia]|uniref:glycerophosphodiester phosphodiesterase n=1 Tax=Spirodela intermedia TaxID=51605 RepID=A0A7I8IVG8_SPIIN|nr:unnamed protein product [Spirodela intermedia]CAA6661573.1 unnamed protein product [Spirodela intermedia]
MQDRGWGPRLLFLALLLLIQHSTPGAALKWLTLDGKEPLVIAKGGHSGLYPDSSLQGYGTAKDYSLPSASLWCDVRLTKDGFGICLPELNMDNCTDISNRYPNGAKNYTVNGVPQRGWFSVDYSLDDLYSVTLSRSILSRSDIFDGFYEILTVDDLQQLKNPRLWLNIQHDKFYTGHKLNMTSYLLNITRTFAVGYVSSPELSFLRRVAPRLNDSNTQAVFRFLESGEVEPSTRLTYGSLLNNLTFISTFASGIMVPKNYIWPVNKDLELASASTSVVQDARKAGLKVFAAGFANDFEFAYDYSFDPLKEYLNFVDNGNFSVDGVLTDSPLTASAAIGCLSHGNDSSSSESVGIRKPVVISYGGAGGMFPSCTDLAYKKAVEDGADYIDCPVQVTKDGVLVCMPDIDLFSGTTISKSSFRTRISTIPAIKSTPGAYTFNFTWEEIQKNLKPEISTPYLKDYGLLRNPSKRNAGAFLNLTKFLALAKENTSLSGVLISIEHAPFLLENLGFGVTDEVLKALNASDLKQEVIIQSTNSSVLKKVQQLNSSYKLMYKIEEPFLDIEASAVKDIAGFASFVAVSKKSIYPDNIKFLLNKTRVVEKFKAEKLPVFAYLFQNEFLSVSWDVYNDPIADINLFVKGAGVEGLITEFPATAEAFRSKGSSVLDLHLLEPLFGGNSTPPYWTPVTPTVLVNLSRLDPLPPSPPPLADSDVVEPPLPSAPIPLPSVPPAPAPSPQKEGPPPATNAATSSTASSAAILLLAAALVSLFLI